MKKIIINGLMFFVIFLTQAAYAQRVSNSEIQNIFHRLVQTAKNNGHKVCDAKLTIIPKLKNAMAEKPISCHIRVYFGTGLASDLNRDQIAAVLGHEIVHTMITYKPLVREEDAADVYGVQLAIAAGYDGHQISNFWEQQCRIIQNNHIKYTDRTHPHPCIRAAHTRNA